MVVQRRTEPIRRATGRGTTSPVLRLIPPRPAETGFCALVARALRCRRCSLMLTGADGALTLEESVGLPATLLGTARVAVGEGVAGRVARDRAPLVVAGAAERDGLPGPLGDYASDAFVAFPMTLPDGTVGVLSVTDREDGTPFGAADLALLAQLADFYAESYDAPARREVLRLRAELRRMRSSVIQTQEHERQRLARELHDDAGHVLTGAVMRLDAAVAQLIGGGPVPDALADVRGALTECASHLHDLAFNLRPRLLTDLGLAPALRSLARRVREDTGIETEVRIHGKERRLDADVELAAFRIAQEGITNALKHARASRVVIGLTFTRTGIVLRIRDDGIGFVAGAERCPSERDRHGLRGMHERAELAGGTLDVTGRPGRGTTLCARLPKGTPS